MSCSRPRITVARTLYSVDSSGGKYPFSAGFLRNLTKTPMEAGADRNAGLLALGADFALRVARDLDGLGGIDRGCRAQIIAETANIGSEVGNRAKQVGVDG